MSVLLLGHSFLRRLKDRLLPSARKQNLVWNRHLSRTLLARLNIDHKFSDIYALCEGLNFINDIYQYISIVQDIHPSCILIEIGSNDLSKLHCYNPARCLDLAHDVFMLASALETFTDLIIIHGVLPRFSRIRSTADTFYRNCLLFNNNLKHFCDSGNKIKFVRLRGFYHTAHTEYPFWTTDGIHCNTDIGFDKYKARLRHSLLYHRHLLFST